MLSRSGMYALQASLHLAQRPPEARVSASSMAEALDLPPDYLAKVLRRLSRAGVLRVKRGVHGGYALAAAPDAVTVEQVVGPFDEPTAPRVCLLGGPCTSDRPCPAHRRRLEWNDARRTILEHTTLSDLLPRPSSNGHPEPAPTPATIDHKDEEP